VDTAAAEDSGGDAIRHLRRDGLVVASPASIEKTAIALLAATAKTKEEETWEM